MKRLLIIMLICLVRPCFCQIPTYDWKQYELKGKVQSVIDSTISINSKKEKHVSITISNFSPDGFLTSTSYCQNSNRDTATIKTYFKYNEQHKLIEKSEYYKSNQPREIRTYTYVGDSIIKEQIQNNFSNNVFSKSVTEYSRDHRQTKTNYFNRNNVLGNQTASLCDTLGNLLKIVSKTKAGLHTEIYTNQYNSKGFLTKYSKFTPITSDQSDGATLEIIYTYLAYDEQGNWVSRKSKLNSIFHKIVKTIDGSIAQRKIVYYK